jgi:hypothetical protein
MSNAQPRLTISYLVARGLLTLTIDKLSTVRAGKIRCDIPRLFVRPSSIKVSSVAQIRLKSIGNEPGERQIAHVVVQTALSSGVWGSNSGIHVDSKLSGMLGSVSRVKHSNLLDPEKGSTITETWVPVYQCTRRNIQDDLKPQTCMVHESCHAMEMLHVEWY